MIQKPISTKSRRFGSLLKCVQKDRFAIPKLQRKFVRESLEAGEYDWAHLALTLRPDEVREKCKTDRSLAIARGLEELCEVKAPEKKAKKGKKKKEVELELEEEGS